MIAAAFGVGAAYDANYNYAYVLPGFLLILLGGINGPFPQRTMVSGVLSGGPRQEGGHILAALNTSGQRGAAAGDAGCWCWRLRNRRPRWWGREPCL